jgi:16S rRNA (cytosine1402-N4)-methyltransferase
MHQPVLLHEVINFLQVKTGEAYLDATVGPAGHSVEILKKGGRLFGLDVDPAALERAKNRLQLSCPGADFTLKQANFKDLQNVVAEWHQDCFAGILLDLGLSSEQIADQSRGFSFSGDGPLDMRADPNLTVTAADLLSGLNEGELSELFTKLAEEHRARTIANAIVRARREQPIRRSNQLTAIVEAAGGRQDRVFQALRIAVNDELNNLKAVLPQAVRLLKTGGRLIIISFHSLEDRIVKNFMKENNSLKIITKKPIINRKPHAVLRAAEKL